MDVVGWSPSEELQDAFQIPPQVEGWTGAEDGESALYAGPSSYPFPQPPSPRPESASVHQRRLKDPEHVPRPRNAFIIFRCDFTQSYLANGGAERAAELEKKSLSKRAGEAWRNEKPETKRLYKQLADEEGARHRITHPGYRFRPKRQKPAGRGDGGRSSRRRASSPHSKRAAGRSTSPSSAERTQISRNDPLQIQTITVPTSSSMLSQPYPSRQPTPEFFHGYGSTTPTSPCSPLSPVDEMLYMPRPAIATGRPDSFLEPYTTDDSQFYGDPLAQFPGGFPLFGQTHTVPESAQSYDHQPLAAVASSLAGWDGTGRGQKEDVDSVTQPGLQHDSDFINPFLSFSLSDGSMGYLGMPFGSDIGGAQYDMDAYRMGLKEYGIPPATNL